MNREVRLARTMILDAMLIGVMLASDDDAKTVCDAVSPSDMTSVTAQRLLEAIKDKDRKRFGKLMARRYGVDIRSDERAVPAILRTVLTRNASEALRGMSAAIAEQVRETDSIGDVIEQWEEGLAVLRRVAALEQKHKEQK